MKTNLLRKFKWYMVGFSLVVIMLSVGLSFCSWDDYSLKSVTANGKTGSYAGLYEIVDDKYSDDKFTPGENYIANVGDIISYGRYYQNANDTTNKSSLRWIVVDTTVDADGSITLTLLTENVVAFGSFWGTYYYNSSNVEGYGTQAKGTFYQNYSQSTVRAWLNSSATRNDGGPQIDGSGIYAGFLREAFSAKEQNNIINKSISGMIGSGKDNIPTNEKYATISDKVWLPSCSEVYGNNTVDWKENNDGFPNKQFRYFTDDSKRIGRTTAFASSSASNYTWKGATHANNYQNSSAGDAVKWWLRSPFMAENFPDGLYKYSSVVYVSGELSGHTTRLSYGGIRPAICIPA